MATHNLGMAVMASSFREMVRQNMKATKRGGVFIDALTGLQVEERSTMTPDRIVQAYAGIVEVAARGRRRRSVAMARVPMPVTETLNGVAPHRNRLRRCGGGTGPDTNATFGYFSERARTGLSLGEPCISASRRG